MVSESFKPTRKEGRKIKQQAQQLQKKKAKQMQLETQSKDSEAVHIQSKIQATD